MIGIGGADALGDGVTETLWSLNAYGEAVRLEPYICKPSIKQAEVDVFAYKDQLALT